MSRRGRPRRVMFASRIVRVGRGSSWQASAADAAITLFFPNAGESLFVSSPRLFADPNVAIVAFHDPRRCVSLPPVNPAGSCDWFSVGARAFDGRLQGSRRRTRCSAPGTNGRIRVSWGPTHPRTYLRQRAIVEYLRRAARPDPFLVEEAVMLLVNDVAAEIDAAAWPASVALTPHAALAQRVRERLASSFTAREHVRALAAAVHVSPYHLCRVFRRETGLTVQSYRRQLRLRHALDLLANSQRDLPGIARSLGFSNHSHFTAAFRETYGVTPSIFREWRDANVWRLVLSTPHALESDSVI